jgi:hydrogenase nickel incorporation protein HypA/HybF
MHERGLAESLIKKILAIARKEGAAKVVKVSVQLGALSQMSPSHFKEHFNIAARDTIVEHAMVEAEVSSDTEDPQAAYVVLKGIDLL